MIESPAGKNPYLLAEYRESESAPTVLVYGHGDVLDGMAGKWRDNLDPWRMTIAGDRVYGRGTADNKGQHSINLSALGAVREAHGGRLGFNAKFLIETGEEIGSPDLRQVCEEHCEELRADLLLASDGPRLSAERPTIFLGCRGGTRIHLDVNLREGAHHSGNLSAAERLYAWNTLEVLAMSSGDIDKPINAIPGNASAVLQLRFVVGTGVDNVVDVVRSHLRERGFPMVEVRATQSFAASRTDLNSPWISWAAESIRKTTGKAPAVLPNFGGSLPNDVFADLLGLSTIWVPHSYPGCSQHAPDEHILLSVTEEALGIMAGLFWDLGELKRPL